jgi:hypothetical protein
MTTAPDGGPDNRTPERGRQLVDLAAYVRSEVTKLRAITGDLASTVAEFGPQLVDTQKDIANLRGEVEQLVAGRAETDNPPVDWVHLAAEDAEREWPKLGEWVHEVLGGWYFVTRAQLPDCWALHRPAFLQVAWLRSSHIEAYLGHSHPAQAAEWNTRWLDAALAKIKECIPRSQCRAVAGQPGEHLVDQLAVQQRHETAPAPAAAGSNPYPNPYAQGPHPATLASQSYPPVGTSTTASATESPAARGAGEEVINWDYWGGYFNHAMQADIAWRRKREAHQADNSRPAAEQTDTTGP